MNNRTYIRGGGVLLTSNLEKGGQALNLFSIESPKGGSRWYKGVNPDG